MQIGLHFYELKFAFTIGKQYFCSRNRARVRALLFYVPTADILQHNYITKILKLLTIMKQKLLNSLRLRVCTLVAMIAFLGAGQAWAAEEVYKTALFGSSYNSKNVSSYTNEWTATNDNFTVALTNFNNNNSNWDFVKTGNKNAASVGTITTYEAIDQAITKVAVTIDAITASSVNSIKLYSSADNSTWTEVGPFSKATGVQEVALASPAADLYYKVEFDCVKGSSNGLVTVSKVEYYYNPGGAVSPSISADDVEIAYNATSSAIEYTINNGVADGSLSATTEAEWLTIGTIGTTVPFTCTANESGERSATVTLTYTYNTSETVTKNVIVTQAANPNGPGSENNPYTVAQARAAIDAGTGTTDVYVTGIISQIDSYSSSFKSITYWISADGTTTDQFEVYSGKGLDGADFSAVTDIVLGAEVIVFGNIKKYNSTYEFDKNNYLVSYSAPAVAVEAPTFSPAAGTYADALSVTISCATSGASIYYTTDGTEPTSASSLYSGAIAIDATTTIKAIAINGSDVSTVTTATYHINSQANPYTVAQALAFNEYPANGIYVSGIVSTAPTAAPSSGALTYYISDNGEATNQLEVYKGKGLEQASFTAQDDIQVGDIVTIYGNVQVYNSTIEFGSGNYLVSFERPQSTEPVINADDVTIAYDATSGEIAYTIENEVEGTTLSASTDATWLTLGTVTEGSVPFTCSANDDDADRTATITLTYGEVTKEVTVTQGHPVVDYATLPFEWEGGASADLTALNGITANGLGSDYAAGNAPYLVKFDGTGDYILVKTNERPGIVTIGVKMLGGSNASSIIVQESADGETFADLQTLSISGSQNDVLTLETTTEFAEASRYVRLYFTKGSNVGVGPITIAQYAEIVLNDYTLTIANPANVTITATYGEEVLSNGDEAEVEQGTEITLAITPAQGYDFENLTITGAEEGQTVTPTEAQGLYTFTMPAYNVTVNATVVEHVEPITATYTLATSITSGKTYVIANADGTKVMGGQNTNNRAAVDATLDGTTLTAANACEFTIEGNATNGYTIYDAAAEGYLYAASSSKNWLMTQSENDVNGIWTITFDASSGEASVIAAGSSNERNVMHFNPNSGNPIFSCYASTSTVTGPVYFYEKVEEVDPYAPETITLNTSGYATFTSTSAFEFQDATVATAWEITAVADGAITFSQIQGPVVAGTGVLLKGSASASVAPTYLENGNVLEDNKLVGITAATTIAADLYYGLKGDQFKKVSAGTVPAGKALLPATEVQTQVKAFTFVFEGADGVRTIETVSAEEAAAIFNLAGQRLQKAQRGVNIINGKKVIVK